MEKGHRNTRFFVTLNDLLNFIPCGLCGDGYWIEPCDVGYYDEEERMEMGVCSTCAWAHAPEVMRLALLGNEKTDQLFG